MDDAWRRRYGHQYQRQSRPVIASVHDYRDGDRQTWHSHEQAQLVYSARGVLRVLTPVGAWTLAPLRGLWLPPGMGHELHAIGDGAMHSAYLEPDAAPWLWSQCRVLQISLLLHELVRGMLDEKEAGFDARADLIEPLLLNEILHAREIHEGGLPLPRDRRLLQICELLMETPDNVDTLGLWGERVGASERTLARLFRTETGLTFGQWRQQLRIVEAVSRLAHGLSIAAIATELGYRNSSAFITMFKKAVGETPQRFLKAKSPRTDLNELL